MEGVEIQISSEIQYSRGLFDQVNSKIKAYEIRFDPLKTSYYFNETLVIERYRRTWILRRDKHRGWCRYEYVENGRWRTTGVYELMTLRIAYSRNGISYTLIYCFNYKKKRRSTRVVTRLRSRQVTFNLRYWVSVKETSAVIMNRTKKSKTSCSPHFARYHLVDCSIIVNRRG